MKNGTSRALWIINILISIYDFQFFLLSALGAGLIEPSLINSILSYIVVAATLTLIASSVAALRDKRTSFAILLMKPAALLVALSNLELSWEGIRGMRESGETGARFILQFIGWAIWLCLNLAQARKRSSRHPSDNLSSIFD